jgi:hypothetical protein
MDGMRSRTICVVSGIGWEKRNLCELCVFSEVGGEKIASVQFLPDNRGLTWQSIFFLQIKQNRILLE